MCFGTWAMWSYFVHSRPWSSILQVLVTSSGKQLMMFTLLASLFCSSDIITHTTVWNCGFITVYVPSLVSMILSKWNSFGNCSGWSCSPWKMLLVVPGIGIPLRQQPIDLLCKELQGWNHFSLGCSVPLHLWPLALEHSWTLTSPPTYSALVEPSETLLRWKRRYSVGCFVVWHRLSLCHLLSRTCSPCIGRCWTVPHMQTLYCDFCMMPVLPNKESAKGIQIWVRQKCQDCSGSSSSPGSYFQMGFIGCLVNGMHASLLMKNGFSSCYFCT